MQIAVVIPALDEAAEIAEAIASAKAPAVEADVEVVVVDGGSADATRSRAHEAGARVLRSQPGRGRQLQVGVEATAGDPIVFLHADTRLPSGWDVAIRRVLDDPDVVGGAFALRLDGRGSGLRAVESMANWRSRWLGLPYGDQALFVRRNVLAAIGGVPNVPLMEDLDLVTAMRAKGKLELLPDAATTSARRYVESGLLVTVSSHALALGAWSIGIDRGRIAGWLGR